MTKAKASSGLHAGSAGPGPTTKQKAAAAQGDKAAKAVRRPVPKRLRMRVLGNAGSAFMPPPVILWDDPVDPAAGAKPKR